jgi:hypothetical protein
MSGMMKNCLMGKDRTNLKADKGATDRSRAIVCLKKGLIMPKIF